MKQVLVRLMSVLAISSALMAIGAASASAGAAPERYVYWTDFNGALNRVDANGGGPELVIASAGSSPNGVAIDRETGRVYWAVRGDQAIRSVAADGTDEQTLNIGAATISQPVGVAIDKRRGRILWANSDTPFGISWAALDGSGQGGTLNIGGIPMGYPQGVAIDGVADKIFWANTSPSPEMAGWAKLDDSGQSGVIGGTVAEGSPVGMAFVPTLQRVFWGYYAPSASTSITGAPSAGGPDTPLSTTGANVVSGGGVGYDGATGRLLISDYDGGKISYAAADGSGGGILTAGSAGSPWGSPAATGAGILTSSNAPLVIPGTVGSPTANTLKIQNTGNYPIQLLGTTSSSAEFAPGAGCPGDLVVNESCELTITFTPTSTTAISGEIEIATDAGKFKFTVKSGEITDPPKGVKLSDVRAVKRCAEPTQAGKLSVGFVSATAMNLDVTLQRSSTQRRSLPSRCPERAGQTDFMSKLIGKKSKKSFGAVAGKQTSTLKQMFGTKKLSPGRYRMLFNYKNSSGESARKGTWFWVLDN